MGRLGAQKMLKLSRKHEPASTTHAMQSMIMDIPIYSFESLLDCLPWVDGLTGDHANIFRTNDSEACLVVRTEESFKTTERASGHISRKATGVAPVSEAVSVAFGITSDHGNEGKAA
jgi:hypothetical protein